MLQTCAVVLIASAAAVLLLLLLGHCSLPFVSQILQQAINAFRVDFQLANTRTQVNKQLCFACIKAVTCHTAGVSARVQIPACTYQQH
jgi:hypothetical protein